MKNYVFSNPIEAWVNIIKMFINQEPSLFEEGQGAIITGSSYTYGLTMLINDAKFDPEFDFGKIMGYTQGKWSSLLNNYLDLDAMDVLKAQVR